jgi:hypothetical protein
LVRLGRLPGRALPLGAFFTGMRRTVGVLAVALNIPLIAPQQLFEYRVVIHGIPLKNADRLSG